MGYSECQGRTRPDGICKPTILTKSGTDVSNATCAKRDRAVADSDEAGCAGFADGGWWSVEPDVGRVANGVPSRVDRLKCLGNAVVPQQAYPIFRAIADTEPYWRLSKERSVV